MALTTLDPGAFSARLELLRPVFVADGQGGGDVSYTLVATTWARIEPVSMTVTEEANGEIFRVTHEIWLRARGDIESGMRFRRGSRAFKIVGWRDPDETGRYTVCRCEETGG